MQEVRVAERHEIEQGRSAPQPRPRDLQKEHQLRGPRALLRRLSWFYANSRRMRFQSLPLRFCLARHATRARESLTENNRSRVRDSGSSDPRYQNDMPAALFPAFFDYEMA